MAFRIATIGTACSIGTTTRTARTIGIGVAFRIAAIGTACSIGTTTRTARAIGIGVAFRIAAIGTACPIGATTRAARTIGVSVAFRTPLLGQIRNTRAVFTSFALPATGPIGVIDTLTGRTIARLTQRIAALP